MKFENIRRASLIVFVLLLFSACSNQKTDAGNKNGPEARLRKIAKDAKETETISDASSFVAVMIQETTATTEPQMSLSFYDVVGKYLYNKLQSKAVYPAGETEKTAKNSSKHAGNESCDRAIEDREKFQDSFYFDLIGVPLNIFEKNGYSRIPKGDIFVTDTIVATQLSDGTVAFRLGPNASELISKHVDFKKNLPTGSVGRGIICSGSKPIVCNFFVDPVTGEILDPNK